MSKVTCPPTGARAISATHPRHPHRTMHPTLKIVIASATLAVAMTATVNAQSSSGNITGEAIAGIDRVAILDRSWQLIAHASQLREAGDHIVADLGGLPVIGVRGGDGAIRVFHNVCRHRAGPIAQCDGLRAKSLRCRYHGWNYGLDGVL